MRPYPAPNSFFAISKLLRDRRSQIYQWYSVDNEASFRNLQPGVTPYDENSVDYCFNSYGFRCEEFTEEADLSIIFIGCSFTEGIGTPVRDIWAHQIIHQLRVNTGLKIPYWNLGIVGSGLDAIAETVYWFSENIPIKPNLVVGLFPDSLRRVSSYKKEVPTFWLPALGWDVSPEDDVIVDLHYGRYQSIRSLMLIQKVLEAWGTKFVGSTWSQADTQLYAKFPKLMMLDFPFSIYSNPPSFARDGKHWGPERNAIVRDFFWEPLQKLL